MPPIYPTNSPSQAFISIAILLSILSLELLYRGFCPQSSIYYHMKVINKTNRTKHLKTFYEKRLFNYHNGLNKQVEKGMFYQAMHRAKQKGWEFTITLDDIVIPSHCPVLGIEIKSATGGRPTPNSPSLDRKNSMLGYTKENTVVISYKANCIKSNGTIEDHRKVIEYMEKY